MNAAAGLFTAIMMTACTSEALMAFTASSTLSVLRSYPAATTSLRLRLASAASTPARPALPKPSSWYITATRFMPSVVSCCTMCSASSA
ncbi:hypothetical protein D3C80_2070540 [compost metagenome]